MLRLPRAILWAGQVLAGLTLLALLLAAVGLTGSSKNIDHQKLTGAAWLHGMHH